MMIRCVRGARFLKLWKAYPLRIKSGLWMLLELCGMNKRYLEVVLYLYETTEHNVRGREGLSEGWMSARVVPMLE